jgi:sulfite exporter TauE/SafE
MPKSIAQQQKKLHWFVAAILIIAIGAYIFFGGHISVFGATYTFSQSIWSTLNANSIATHTDNQSGWTSYSATSTGLAIANGGADLQIDTAAFNKKILKNVFKENSHARNS